MQTIPTRVLGPGEGKAGFLGSIGVRFMVDGEPDRRGPSRWSSTRCRRTRWPRRRVRRHRPRGRVQLSWSRGGWAPCSARRCSRPGPATWCSKPRGEWHTFWNAGRRAVPHPRGDRRPAGFERFFAELVELGGAGRRSDPGRAAASCAGATALEMDPSERAGAGRALRRGRRPPRSAARGARPPRRPARRLAARGPARRGRGSRGGA